MKPFYIFSICIFSLMTSVSGQNNSTSSETFTENIDSIPITVKKDLAEQPACFINGKFSTQTILSTIDAKLIDNIRVEKDELEINGKKYYGQILIKTKDEYNPQLISLTDFAKKHTTIKDEIIIFMIDDKFVKNDYEQSLVDEKYILRIVTEIIENEEQTINIIRLITKSKENTEKPKEIRIRE